LPLIINDKAPATRRYVDRARENGAAQIRKIAALRALRLCCWKWADGPGFNAAVRENTRYAHRPRIAIDLLRSTSAALEAIG
jgi:hypothetical protein